MESTEHRVGIYAWTPTRNGPARFRIVEPLRVARNYGIKVDMGPILDDLILSRCDTLLVHGIHEEHHSEAWLRLAELETHRLIIDIDDLMWRPDWTPFREHYTPEALDRLKRNIRAAYVVTTTTEYLAEEIHKWTGHPNIHVIPNTVPAWLTQHEMPPREHPTICWQGSPSHAPDWGTTGRQLGRFLAVWPEWRVTFYGAGGDGHPHPQITTTPWLPVDEYWRTVSADVGIGPLRDTPFNRAKSALRVVEYAALGIVPVLPYVPTYQGWISDGMNGLYVRPHETLRGKLHQLASEPGWLKVMSQNARACAAEWWTTEANISQWVKAWNSV